MTTYFSSIYLSMLAVAGGLVLLWLGGDFLVSGAVKLARRWGMSTMLIGLTVVAFGTSMPELFVSLMAVFQDHPDIMAGNVVGSNIANIGLILGFSALLSPLRVRLQDISTELYLVLAGSLTLALITWRGTFSRSFGLLFIGTLVLYTVLSYRREIVASRKSDDNGTAANGSTYPAIILRTVGGLVLLAYGSRVFINGAVDVAIFFKISELIIGLTLAALGTSLPELASCIAAIRQKQGDLLVGNIVGSNLFNLLMVLGCAATIKPFSLSPDLLTRDLPLMIAFSAVLIPILAIQKRLNRWHGLVFLVGYAAYIFMLA